ncbi:hypothetical protein TNCV_2781331 [Trichonephila clavipes]|nr:hypothetical protein TNCV_2781331 [Trichonephila clavipes]
MTTRSSRRDATEYPPWGNLPLLNVLPLLWCGNLERGVPAQVLSSSFDRGSRFRGIFDVQDAPRIGRPVIENVDKITEIIEVDRHVSSRSIAQELQIDIKQF